MRALFTKKRVYALMILAGSILFSFVIAKTGSTPHQDTLVSMGSSGESAKRSPYFASIQEPVPQAATPEPLNPAGSLSGNITENVLNAYTLQILKQNPRGSGLAGSKIAVPTEDALTSIVSDQLNTQSLTIPTYSVRDIRVSETAPTKEELIAYFKTVVEMHAKEFKNVTSNYFLGIIDAFQNGRMVAAQSQLDAASRYVNDLLSIKVPLGWGAFHVELLDLWQARFSLGTIISQSAEDPFKAYLAINKLSESIDREDRLLETLKTEMGKSLGQSSL